MLWFILAVLAAVGLFLVLDWFCGTEAEKQRWDRRFRPLPLDKQSSETPPPAQDLSWLMSPPMISPPADHHRDHIHAHHDHIHDHPHHPYDHGTCDSPDSSCSDSGCSCD